MFKVPFIQTNIIFPGSCQSEQPTRPAPATSPPVVDLTTMAAALKQRCKGCFIIHTPGKFCNRKRNKKATLKSNINIYKPTKVEVQAILKRIKVLTGSNCVLCCLEQVHICREDLVLEQQVELAAGLPRRRGGADIPEEVILESLRMAGIPMVETAKAVASHHNITLHHPIPNMASGDCAFESCIDQLNHSRSSEFTANGVPQFPDHAALRTAVVRDLTTNTMAQMKAGYTGKTRQWKRDIKQLLVPGQWDTTVGDLVIPGIAFTTKKTILILHTR